MSHSIKFIKVDFLANIVAFDTSVYRKSTPISVFTNYKSFKSIPYRCKTTGMLLYLSFKKWSYCKCLPRYIFHNNNHNLLTTIYTVPKNIACVWPIYLFFVQAAIQTYRYFASYRQISKIVNNKPLHTIFSHVTATKNLIILQF